MRDLSQRVSQSSHQSEQQLDGINREVEAGAVSLKRLTATLSSLSANFNKSEERLFSHISLVEERCTHEHDTLSANLTSKIV